MHRFLVQGKVGGEKASDAASWPTRLSLCKALVSKASRGVWKTPTKLPFSPGQQALQNLRFQPKAMNVDAGIRATLTERATTCYRIFV